MQENSISKRSVRPSHTCLVLERGYAAIEFLEDADLEELTEWRFQDSEVLIVVKTPDGILNCIGCEPHQVIKSISDSFQMFKIKTSRWGVLCSPAVNIMTMALLSGAYDYIREAV